MATVESATLKTPQRVRGIPVIGSALAMVKDPAKFFVDCYRKYGPVFRIQILSNTYTVLAGAETANFMGTRQGRDSLRSKEFWQGLVDEWRARRTLTSEDGEMRQRLRGGADDVDPRAAVPSTRPGPRIARLCVAAKDAADAGPSMKFKVRVKNRRH
jgi:hypothetical protein